MLEEREENMGIENVLKKCGFDKDTDNYQLTKAFHEDIMFKEIYIDIYSDNPFDNTSRPMLLLRRYEREPIILNNDEYLIIEEKNNGCNCIMNISFDSIKDVYFKKSNENSFDCIFNCQNIYYKITILE